MFQKCFACGADSRIFFRENPNILLPCTGGGHPLDDGPNDCFVFVRRTDAQSFLIALNFSEDEQRVAMPMPGRLQLSTHPDRDEEEVGEVVALRGHEGVVVAIRGDR